MKNKFIYLLATLIILSCQNDNIEFDVLESAAKTHISTFITLEKAINKADVILTQLKDSSMTRSIPRSIKDVYCMTSTPLSRAGSGGNIPDTLLYLINYNENKGFALLGADKRLQEIYAISDEGELNFSDTIDNIGLKIFFDMTRENIYRVLNVATPNKDITGLFGHQTILKIESRVEPYLWPEVRKWNQNYPYNKYCYTKEGQQAAVGCVAVAVLQIMSFYNCPEKLDGERLSWRTMKKGTSNDAVAKLMRKLGNSDLLDMLYGTKESSAKFINTTRTFLQMGYKDVVGYTNCFDDYLVRNWLKGNEQDLGMKYGPVLMSGADRNAGGHSWVIDGYIRNAIYANSGADKDKYYFWSYDDTLYHCVWGFGGKSDGYFYFVHYDDGIMEQFDGPPALVGQGDNSDNLPYSFTDRIQLSTGYTPE